MVGIVAGHLLYFISESTYNTVHMEIKYTKLISESTAPFFIRQNLEVILGTNRRTLDYRIRSLITKGMLTRIKTGVYINTMLLKYSSSPEELMRYIGCQIVPNSYISLEYALASYGILAESAFAMTFITMGKTRTFETDRVRLIYRNIQPRCFIGYSTKQTGNFTYTIATPAKALFDFLYLTPFKTASAMREFVINSRLNWDTLSPTDKKELKDTIRISQSKKMNRMLQFLMSKKIL